MPSPPAKKSGLSNEQRRANINTALEKVRTSSTNPSGTIQSGGKTGGTVGQSGVKGSWQATGGGTTRIVMDAETGESQVVESYNISQYPVKEETTQVKSTSKFEQVYGIKVDTYGYIKGESQGVKFAYGKGVEMYAPSSAELSPQYAYRIPLSQSTQPVKHFKAFEDLNYHVPFTKTYVGEKLNEMMKYDVYEKSYGKGEPSEYAKFIPKQKPLFSVNYPIIRKEGGNIILESRTQSTTAGEFGQAIMGGVGLILFPVKATIQATKVDKLYEYTMEKAGRGYGYAYELLKINPQLKKQMPRFTQPNYGYAPERLTRTDMGALDLYKPKKVETSYQINTVLFIGQTAQKSLALSKKDYTDAGIYYKTGVDISLGLIYPIGKTTYELARQEHVNPLELGVFASVGAGWAVGTNIAKYTTERILVSKALETSANIFPKGAKLVSWAVKGSKAGIEYGLPATYVADSFMRVAVQPTPEMKRMQSSQIAKEMAYYTTGALPAGYLSGLGIKSVDALSRIYKVEWIKVSKANNAGINANSPVDIMMGGYSLDILSITKASKLRSVNRLVRESVIKGEENFPTDSPNINKQLNLFQKQREYILPIEEGKYMYHATPSQLGKEISIRYGSSEVAGLYGSTEASIYFLKLRGEGKTNIYSFSGESTLSPTIIRQGVSDFKRIGKVSPTDVDMNIFSNLNLRSDYIAENLFILTKAEKGVGYVVGRKSEIEAVIAPKTISISKGNPFYTFIPSMKQAQPYEFFSRQGYPEAVRRVKPFKLVSPSTWYDKFMGRKTGQFKEFGIKRGQLVPIELRELGKFGGETKSNSRTIKEYSFSSEERYSKSKVSAYNISALSSYSVSLKNYSMPSYTSSARTSKASNISSIISSKVLSGLSSYSRLYSSLVSSKKSSIMSGGSSLASYSAASYFYSSGGSYSRLSRGYSGFTRITTTTPSMLFDMEGEKKIRKGKKKYSRKLKYQPSLIGIDMRIMKQFTPILTGTEIRGF